MIETGMARVMPSDINPEKTSDLLKAEDIARKNKAGLWARYPVLIPENADQAMGSYRIVEGTIRKTAVAQNNLYLNFGENWKTDFTVMITPDIRKKLARRNIEPQSLAGKRVRVRGDIRSYNGAFVELANPDCLEVFPVTELFPEINPYSTGYLDVPGGHHLYWEQCGNPNGVPVVFLHGGPGGGISPTHRRFFDPDYYRIVLFDQPRIGKIYAARWFDRITRGHIWWPISNPCARI